jgi:hypothetical protein
MISPNGSRRAAVLWFGATFVLALVVATCGLAPDATAQTPPAPDRFRTIRIDVSPLASKGLAPEASWLSRDLPAALHAAFAGRLAPGDSGAPVLVVRIDGVFLGMPGGGGTAPFGDNAARDEIEGAAIVVAPNGKPIANYPLFTTLIADTGGPVLEMGMTRGRVAELAKSFAYWLPGQMGL